eukprot:gene2500-3247_t
MPVQRASRDRVGLRLHSARSHGAGTLNPLEAYVELGGPGCDQQVIMASLDSVLDAGIDVNPSAVQSPSNIAVKNLPPPAEPFPVPPDYSSPHTNPAEHTASGSGSSGTGHAPDSVRISSSGGEQGNDKAFAADASACSGDISVDAEPGQQFREDPSASATGAQSPQLYRDGHIGARCPGADLDASSLSTADHVNDGHLACVAAGDTAISSGAALSTTAQGTPGSDDVALLARQHQLSDWAAELKCEKAAESTRKAQAPPVPKSLSLLESTLTNVLPGVTLPNPLSPTPNHANGDAVSTAEVVPAVKADISTANPQGEEILRTPSPSTPLPTDSGQSVNELLSLLPKEDAGELNVSAVLAASGGSPQHDAYNSALLPLFLRYYHTPLANPPVLGGTSAVNNPVYAGVPLLHALGTDPKGTLPHVAPVLMAQLAQLETQRKQRQELLRQHEDRRRQQMPKPEPRIKVKLNLPQKTKEWQQFRATDWLENVKQRCGYSECYSISTTRQLKPQEQEELIQRQYDKELQHRKQKTELQDQQAQQSLSYARTGKRGKQGPLRLSQQEEENFVKRHYEDQLRVSTQKAEAAEKRIYGKSPNPKAPLNQDQMDAILKRLYTDAQIEKGRSVQRIEAQMYRTKNERKVLRGPKEMESHLDRFYYSA